MGYYIIYIMAGWVADKSWLLIMVLQIDSENSATGYIYNAKLMYLKKNQHSAFLLSINYKCAIFHNPMSSQFL